MKQKTITTTRFNNDTFQKNRSYTKRSEHEGCIYGTPIKMKSTVPMETPVYVIEMNNDKNYYRVYVLIQEMWNVYL